MRSGWEKGREEDGCATRLMMLEALPFHSFIVPTLACTKMTPILPNGNPAAVVPLTRSVYAVF